MAIPELEQAQVQISVHLLIISDVFMIMVGNGPEAEPYVLNLVALTYRKVLESIYGLSSRVFLWQHPDMKKCNEHETYFILYFWVGCSCVETSRAWILDQPSNSMIQQLSTA